MGVNAVRVGEDLVGDHPRSHDIAALHLGDCEDKIGSPLIEALESFEQRQLPYRIPTLTHPDFRAIEFKRQWQAREDRQNHTCPVEAAVALVNKIEFFAVLAPQPAQAFSCE